MNRDEYQNGLLLGGSTAIALLVITLAFFLTRAPIAKTEHAQLENNLSQLIAHGSYNNQPANDFIEVADPLLGSHSPQRLYRARLDGHPTGIVISAVTDEGYNGEIALLIGFSIEGDIVAVRVTNHRETPGLGDDIEERRSDWIHSFASLSPASMPIDAWNVKKSGGDFDQFTGATITPRAVIKAVKKASEWYQMNRHLAYKQSAES